MSRRFLLVIFAACGSSGHPTKKPNLPESDPPPVVKQPVTVERVVVSLTRDSGTDTTTVNPDGSLTIAYDTLWNGRGPKSDATITLAPDGTIATLDSAGHTMETTPEEEHFARKGDHATWKSAEESGDQDVSGKAFFMPISDVPDVTGLLVAAALENGGSIPLLPSGTATVEKGPSVALTGADGEKRTVVSYAITGLDVLPEYTWMNQDGSWFGNTYEWWSVIPKNFATSIDPLIAAQNQLGRTRDAALAQAQAHVPPAAGRAYTHARVLDVEKGKWLLDQTVVIVGDRITAVGAAKKVKVPAGAEVVDLAGKAILPGLVDMHAHLGDESGVLDIASGVTTARDVGNDPDKLDDYKARFDAGTAIGPHVFRYGFIEGRGEKAASAKITAETEEEAQDGVKFFVDRGYDGIKIYNSIKPELVPVITKAAHASGKKVTGHIPAFMLAEEAVKAGYDGIEHINFLFLNFLATHETDTRDPTRFILVGEKGADLDFASKPVKKFIKLLHDHKTIIDPTLGAFESLWAGEPGKVLPGLEDTVARLPPLAQRGWLLNGLPGADHVQFEKSWEHALDLVRLLYQSNVTLVCGTDSLAGLMLHHEIALFVRAKIPVVKVLAMATIGAARALGHDKDFGSIAKGKQADLFVVDGDPLKNLGDLDKVVETMRGGVVYQSAPLFEAYGVSAAR